jgi:Bacteriophage Lambda NinG protein
LEGVQVSFVRIKKRLRKRTKKPLGVLKRKLDSELAQMVRDRDEKAPCISCRNGGQKQAGHFMRRELLATRWHPLNVNGQCSHCNCWLHGNQLEYADNLDRLYGSGTAARLRQLARLSWKPTREALEKLLESAKLGHEAYQETWNFYGSDGLTSEKPGRSET